MSTPPDNTPKKIDGRKRGAFHPNHKNPPPQFGNKHAVGNEGGRPRKYDYVAEGKELYEWSKLPNSTAVYQFTRDKNKEYLADELDEFADRCPDFALYYKKAKENIGQNREDLCNQGLVNYGVWARSAARYHAGLHKFERADKAYEADLKSKTDAAMSPPLDAILDRDNENMSLKAELAILREKIDNLTKARQELPGIDTPL